MRFLLLTALSALACTLASQSLCAVDDVDADVPTGPVPSPKHELMLRRAVPGPADICAEACRSRSIPGARTEEEALCSSHGLAATCEFKV